jgi:hypothetical protein
MPKKTCSTCSGSYEPGGYLAHVQGRYHKAHRYDYVKSSWSKKDFARGKKTGVWGDTHAADIAAHKTAKPRQKTGKRSMFDPRRKTKS